MKKNIGARLALYPTPLVVVGTMVNGKPNWTLVGHLGIIGHDRVMVSMSDSHYSNQGIRAMKTLSINIVDEAMLKEADYAGCVSGANEDKSQLFAHIDLKTRSIITVVALMAQGITDSSLKFHLQNAKDHGVTQKEIAAIITHIAFYAGWPKGWAVFNLAKEVWNEEEIEK